MPHKTKKKFIDKKKAVTFQLVHRSQKDPLAADDEAPQRVLVPLNEPQQEVITQESPHEREMRLSKQKLYGVGFDDDYDYMQHLREPEKQTTILIPKSNRVTFQEATDQEICHDDAAEEMTEVLKDGGQSASIMIPTVVFASKEEEDIGMLHRAIPPTGPQVEWDPDVVAAMDEDFDFEDPENFIEDDFILKATDEVDETMQDSDEIDENYSGSEDAGSWMSDIDKDEFAGEETRSRFTQYSMSSSVLPRTEHLSLLDDQFEKFYETYDDDKIGDLGQVEIDGGVPVDNIAQEDAIKMLLGIRDETTKSTDTPCLKTVPEENEHNEGVDSGSSSDDSDDHDHMVKLTKEIPKENWDCESILSTYSNIYNHPKLIKDPPKPIKLSKKTGIPLDTLSTRGLTAKQLKILDLENECIDNNSSMRVHTISESSNLTVASNIRQKNETKEEKIARKQAVKDMRRERRMEKKATKVAFRQEKDRQYKEQINLQQNLNGMRIS